MSDDARHIASIEDFLAIPEHERSHELLGGEIVERATPSGEHGRAQAGVVGALLPGFSRRSGQGGPGGWWFATEVEVWLPGGAVVRPDIAGWRRERCSEPPTGTLVEVRPDWVCEVLSPSNANNDTVKKLRLYQQAEVPHYWIVDPQNATLTVMRWVEDGYLNVLVAMRGETVRPEPFEAIELEVGTLFGDDPST